MKLFLIAACLAVAAADVSHILANQDKDATIVRQDLDVGLDGQYHSAYETSNGIKGEEQGELKQIDKDTQAEVVQGQASWIAPGGEPVQFSYTADENGYQVQGSHLPVPPPIPEAILRSLEFIKAHPPQPEQN